MEWRGMRTGFWWESQKVRDLKEDLDVDKRIILKWIFKKYDWWYGLYSSTSG
jgi:hypothetical protein